MKTSISLVLLATLLLLTSIVSAETAKITKGPVVEHTGERSAVIAWSTNASAATIVRYGTDPNHLSQKAEMPWGGLTHRVMLKNLEPGRTYYFQADSSGNGSATSEVGRFSTTGEQAGNREREHSRPELNITNGPVLEHVGDNDATVAWTTDLPSSSVVRYGTERHNLNQMAQEPWGATTHRVQLKNLRPNTRYFFSVHSAQGKNAPGQAEDTRPQSFTTAEHGREARRNGQNRDRDGDQDHDHR